MPKTTLVEWSDHNLGSILLADGMSLCVDMAPPTPLAVQALPEGTRVIWVPHAETGKLHLCFQGDNPMCRNLLSFTSNVCTNVSLNQAIRTHDVDDVCLTAALSRVGIQDQWIRRAEFATGPYVGMSAFGVGSNVKIRTRTSKLAVILTALADHPCVETSSMAPN